MTYKNNFVLKRLYALMHGGHDPPKVRERCLLVLSVR